MAFILRVVRLGRYCLLLKVRFGSFCLDADSVAFFTLQKYNGIIRLEPLGTADQLFSLSCCMALFHACRSHKNAVLIFHQCTFVSNSLLQFRYEVLYCTVVVLVDEYQYLIDF